MSEERSPRPKRQMPVARNQGRKTIAQAAQLARQAYDLSVQGASYSAISRELKIHQATARRYVMEEGRKIADAMAPEERDAKRVRALDQKRFVFEQALQAFREAEDRSLNRSAYLNTMLAASIAMDKLDGLLTERHEISGGATIKVDVESSFDYTGFVQLWADAVSPPALPGTTDDGGVDAEGVLITEIDGPGQPLDTPDPDPEAGTVPDDAPPGSPIWGSWRRG